MKKAINVTIWNEFRHEKTNDKVREIYPDGIHAYLKGALECEEIKITLAALDDPDQGLPDEVLNNTDVLIWWGHMHHWEVSHELAERVKNRVYAGMGLICLHSAHYSKIIQKVVGMTGHLTWGDEVKEVVWNINPTHPIAAGLPTHFILPKEEIYGEPFQIPEPDELVFIGWYETGHVFRSGCTWRRGYGKVFYFQPGHESVPTFHDANVQKIIKNAIYWAAPAHTEGYKLQDTSPYIGGKFVGEEENEQFRLV
ncbi:MAG: ThuA domain-containing protein [Clostridia bacterium]|nr:ThuA domain-containing protein [Clostridia bacterium]